VFNDDYSGLSRQMIRSRLFRKMALKKIFFPEILKSGDFYFFWEGRERVSKAIDLVSRAGGSHVCFHKMEKLFINGAIANLCIATGRVRVIRNLQ
jgi:hypothetical protein